MFVNRKLYRQWMWLARRFRDYDLVYLDPIICSLVPHESRFSRLMPWRSAPKPGSTVKLLQQIVQAAGLKDEKSTLCSLLKQGRMGSTRQDERSLQIRVADAIEHHLPDEDHHYTVATWQTQKQFLKDISDRPGGSSLVVVDGMFTRRVAAPEEIQRTFDVLFQDSDTLQKRSVESILTIGPPPMSVLQEPMVGLMVDSMAFYSRIATILMRADWYPFVRVVGLCRTNHDGQPYIDVIAILARPHPTLDQVLAPLAGEEQWWNLPGVLNYVRERLMKKEIEEVENEVNKKPVPVEASKRYPAQDSVFLYPVQLSSLCCQLNAVDWHALQTRAPRLYGALEEYLRDLARLGTNLDTLKVESQIVGFVRVNPDITKLIPELPAM